MPGQKIAVDRRLVSLAVVGMLLSPFCAVIALSQNQKPTTEPETESTTKNTAQTSSRIQIEPVQVIVTASRRETALEDASQSVTVVAAKEIEQSAPNKLDELLREAPGVDFKGSYLSRTYEISPISMRGVGPGWGRVLFLLDGIPQEDSAQGFPRENLIPLLGVDRIEILRGASSALYGSEAMGGVINIITRRPSEKNETYVHATYGSLDTHDEEALNMGKLNKSFGYMLVANNFGTRGYIPEETKQAYMTSLYKAENVFGGSLIWKANDNHSITAGAKYLREGYGGGVQYANSERHTTASDLHYQGYHVGPFDLLAHGYYNSEIFYGHESTSAVKFASLEANRVANYVETGGSASAVAHLAEWNVLTGGVDWKKDGFAADRNWVTQIRGQKRAVTSSTFPSFFRMRPFSFMAS